MRIVGCIAPFNVPAFLLRQKMLRTLRLDFQKRNIVYWLVPARLSVKTINQFLHPFCPHHATGFVRNPHRAAHVKLSEACFRQELLESDSIESSAGENRDLWCRSVLIALQPRRPRFPRAVPATGQDPVHLAQLLQSSNLCEWMSRFIESPVKRRLKIRCAAQNLARCRHVYMFLREKSQNHTIDAQRGQNLRLLGEKFDFTWTGNVTLAATQHHPNRDGYVLANFLNGFEIGSKPASFEITHDLQTSGSPALRFQSIFKGSYDHFQQAVGCVCIASFIAHSSSLQQQKSLRYTEAFYLIGQLL